jgi:hypothetical protein
MSAKRFSEMSLEEISKLPVTVVDSPEQPTTKKAREAREQFTRARREREHQNRVAPMAELVSKTPVVSADLAAATTFPNFPAVRDILTHRQQVEDRRRALEVTLAAREAEYQARCQALTAANGHALAAGRDPDPAGVAALARTYHADRATIESELDALTQAEGDLWQRFLAKFAAEVRAYWTTQGTEYRALRLRELSLLEQLHAVQQQRIAQHHAASGEVGRIKKALGNDAPLGPATRTTAGSRVMGTWRDGRSEVVIDRTPDVVEALDTEDAATVRRFCEGRTLGIPTPGLVRDVPEYLLVELIRVLRTEIEREKPAP